MSRRTPLSEPSRGRLRGDIATAVELVDEGRGLQLVVSRSGFLRWRQLVGCQRKATRPMTFRTRSVRPSSCEQALIDPLRTFSPQVAARCSETGRLQGSTTGSPENG